MAFDAVEDTAQAEIERIIFRILIAGRSNGSRQFRNPSRPIKVVSSDQGYIALRGCTAALRGDLLRDRPDVSRDDGQEIQRSPPVRRVSESVFSAVSIQRASSGRPRVGPPWFREPRGEREIRRTRQRPTPSCPVASRPRESAADRRPGRSSARLTQPPRDVTIEGHLEFSFPLRPANCNCGQTLPIGDTYGSNNAIQRMRGFRTSKRNRGLPQSKSATASSRPLDPSFPLAFPRPLPITVSIVHRNVHLLWTTNTVYGRRAASARTSVLISGASVAGPALGYWLSKAGWDVTIVEQDRGCARVDVDFRGHIHLDLLERMGVLAQLQARDTGGSAMRFVDVDGLHCLHLPTDFAGGDLEIRRADLSRVL